MVGEIKGYTDRHLRAKKFLLVTFFSGILALPTILLSPEITCFLGLIAVVSLAAAIWQCILAEIVWRQIDNDVNFLL